MVASPRSSDTQETCLVFGLVVCELPFQPLGVASIQPVSSSEAHSRYMVPLTRLEVHRIPQGSISVDTAAPRRFVQLLQARGRCAFRILVLAARNVGQHLWGSRSAPSSSTQAIGMPHHVHALWTASPTNPSIYLVSLQPRVPPLRLGSTASPWTLNIRRAICCLHVRRNHFTLRNHAKRSVMKASPQHSWSFAPLRSMSVGKRNLPEVRHACLVWARSLG